MKKLIIANWKMQLSYKESLNLAKTFFQVVPTKHYQVVICPGYLSLVNVAKLVKPKIKIGAQDCAFSDEGAYTGEVSPETLKEVGVKYVILGHSERRRYLDENSTLINSKIKAVLHNSLIPILCIGESLTIRKKGETRSFLRKQLKNDLKTIKLEKNKEIIIAYEPLWAIGSGRIIAPSDAEKIHLFIKKESKKILKKNIKVIYGGSINSANASEFLEQENINGLLVGGASLQANEFSKICQL